MSSADVVHVTSLRDPHRRRRHTCQRVFTAAAQLLDESADVDVSMPTLAERANVAPTALRAHFTSLDACSRSSICTGSARYPSTSSRRRAQRSG